MINSYQHQVHLVTDDIATNALIQMINYLKRRLDIICARILKYTSTCFGVYFLMMTDLMIKYLSDIVETIMEILLCKHKN